MKVSVVVVMLSLGVSPKNSPRGTGVFWGEGPGASFFGFLALLPSLGMSKIQITLPDTPVMRSFLRTLGVHAAEDQEMLYGVTEEEEAEIAAAGEAFNDAVTEALWTEVP